MLTKPSFTSEELEQLACAIQAISLPPGDARAWERLLAIGRSLVAASEAAEAAGLVVGAVPGDAALGEVAEAFRRSSGSGTRATIGHMAPRR